MYVMMFRFRCFLAVLVLLHVTRNEGFHVSHRRLSFLVGTTAGKPSTTTVTDLSAVMDGGSGSWGDNLNDDEDGRDDEDDSVDYERYKAALEHNTRRTDVRIFLTQRALQSFINLLITCRDPHTVRWLEVRECMR